MIWKEGVEVLKVCRGCFREWAEEWNTCAYCGWEPEKTYDTILDWTTGSVLEKRYLLGLPYCRTPEAAVWRIYDSFLGISCFAVRMADEERESLYSLSVRIQKLKDLTGTSVKIMAVKSIDRKKVLLFSMDNPDENPETLLAVLRAKSKVLEKAAETQEDLEPAKKKEQVLPNGTLLGERYQILDCIGIGGFGIIYLCHDIELRRLAAVKEYFPEEWAEREETYVSVKKSRMADAYRFGMQSFYKEAKISAKFIHTPHIVTIYDVVEANDTVYLVMEYISGISIGREMRVRNYQPYEPEAMAEILFPVMDALGVLHEERIVHSDISPGNIMRSERGEIFLIDMGAAKYILDSQPTLNAAFLKLDYAAPEQYRTAREGIPKDEGPWTDVYALGATMYYLLTGQKPPDVMQRLEGKNTEVPLPKKCRLKHAKQWKKLLNRAMALEIRERFTDAEELKRETERLLPCRS